MPAGTIFAPSSARLAQDPQHGFRRNALHRNRQFGPDSAEFGPCPVIVGRPQPNLDRSRPMLADVDQAWRTSAKFGPNSVKLGRHRAKSAELNHASTHFARMWPNFDRVWQTMARARTYFLVFANLARRRPKLVRSDQMWSNSGPPWSLLTPSGPIML